MLGRPANLDGVNLPCSFGVVLLEIVTGAVAKVRGQAPQPLVPNECPPDVAQLIESCLAAQPAARPTAKVHWIQCILPARQ
jgi:hypothetical protein